MEENQSDSLQKNTLLFKFIRFIKFIKVIRLLRAIKLKKIFSKLEGIKYYFLMHKSQFLLWIHLIHYYRF